jgi:LEA14-like dessication related protein
MIGIEAIARFLMLPSMCLLVACAAPVTLVDSPSVRLTGIESGRMNFDRQTFVLGFDISNPNTFPLPVKELNYNVKIAGQQFASGKTEGAFTVPSNGDSSFAISVDLNIMQQSSQIGTLLRAGSQGFVSYELDGSLAVDIPLARPIPFSGKGTISLIADL